VTKKLDSTNELDSPLGKTKYYNIRSKDLGYDPDTLPYSIRVLLENTLRFAEIIPGATDATGVLTQWPTSIGKDIPFMPFRVLLQDYTGVPLIVDLAAMRSAGIRKGLKPGAVNSKVPVDLVIDHSIQVDAWGNEFSIIQNLDKEYERNSERYSLLKWAQSSIDNTRVFPPGKGICHQFNLEYLAKVVSLQTLNQKPTAFPDTLVGTDSHTTMVNGLGVLGWGVGGIEAEAVMLGEPYFLPIPKVIGVKFTGKLQEGATPTDLVLTVTEVLRHEDLVGAFVEYFGESYNKLSVPDRATIGNMSPEYGATVGYCPVDDATISYLLGTGRDKAYADFVKTYCVRQGLFVNPDSVTPKYSKVIEINLDNVEPSIAGPRNPDERIPLKSARTTLTGILKKYARSTQLTTLNQDGLRDGSVVIAAITSCTNTSNPIVMLGAGLLASKATKLGLTAKPYVKRSMAPGSNVVRDYLAKVNLLPELEKLGFDIVGYGCTTCIGNSGPLSPDVEKQIREKDLYAVAVLSGNRNFDGRIHPLAKGAFLMSPMLVVAYALAGRIDIDFYNEPLGVAPDGSKVYLKDIWPTLNEIQQMTIKALSPDLFKERYADAQTGDEKWRKLSAPSGKSYEWNNHSTYIREPPWFKETTLTNTDIRNARTLAIFGDKVTTDHISPAGTILADSPAGEYLKQNNVPFTDFSTYGSRRGNHEVMVRGGFSNIRLKNDLANGKEGGWTIHYPSRNLMTIYDAAMRYRSEKVPLLILAGKQYGTGSSRDWAAKATMMLGVRAVIAESFERIHRSNLIAMGVLPLEFSNGQNWQQLNLKGTETYEILGIEEITHPKTRLSVQVKDTGRDDRFDTVARLDNEIEIEYYRAGGILPYVFSKLPTS
jgi:aconitate hydratase